MGSNQYSSVILGEKEAKMPKRWTIMVSVILDIRGEHDR